VVDFPDTLKLILYIINRSLTSIHVNSTLESNGLSRDDRKRPDGMTLVPWIKGQPLVWDVTVVDTLADSYVLKTSEVSGFAAEMACKRKHSKYSSIISSNYIFKGFAFETLGPWCHRKSTYCGIRRFKIKENPFREDFPCHSTWKRCKHSAQIPHYYGNFCIVKQKLLLLRNCLPMYYILVYNEFLLRLAIGLLSGHLLHFVILKWL
jgi:hypothetical protein